MSRVEDCTSLRDPSSRCILLNSLNQSLVCRRSSLLGSICPGQIDVFLISSWNYIYTDTSMTELPLENLRKSRRFPRETSRKNHVLPGIRTAMALIWIFGGSEDSLPSMLIKTRKNVQSSQIASLLIRNFVPGQNLENDSDDEYYSYQSKKYRAYSLLEIGELVRKNSTELDWHYIPSVEYQGLRAILRVNRWVCDFVDELHRSFYARNVFHFSISAEVDMLHVGQFQPGRSLTVRMIDLFINRDYNHGSRFSRKALKLGGWEDVSLGWFTLELQNRCNW